MTGTINLDALAGQVVLVFQPKYSPELQPVERLWRQWRPNVTHNHTRGDLELLEGDSDRWLGRAAAVAVAGAGKAIGQDSAHTANALLASTLLEKGTETAAF